jgi:predicted enzyme related to lactoylglutathione lyase
LLYERFGIGIVKNQEHSRNIMFKKVAFTMYPVVDMARARKFYEDTMGLKISSNYEEKWVEYDLPEGGCFAITIMAEGVSPSANAGGSIAFEVRDLENLVKELKQKNVNFKMDIFETPVCKMAVAIDSEGNAFTLHQLTNR